MSEIVPQNSDLRCIPSNSGIYAIVNIANQHRYVGSSKDLHSRKLRHFRRLKHGNHENSHLQHAYNSYGVDVFRFDILEYVEHAENLLVREQYYIDTLKPEYNIAPFAGSTLGRRLSPETKEKIRSGHTGRKHTLESRLNMGAPKRGRKQSPEHIEKRAAARRGRKLSPEHAAKSRVTFLGGKHTPEARAKMSEARRGRKQSPEHIAARSAALRGRKVSPEHQAKATEAARLANTGKSRSPEVRAKISATRRAKFLAKQQEMQPPLF